MENENMLDKMIGEEIFVISQSSEDEYGYYIAPQTIKVGVAPDPDGRLMLYNHILTGDSDVELKVFIACLMSSTELRISMNHVIDCGITDYEDIFRITPCNGGNAISHYIVKGGVTTGENIASYVSEIFDVNADGKTYVGTIGWNCYVDIVVKVLAAVAKKELPIKEDFYNFLFDKDGRLRPATYFKAYLGKRYTQCLSPYMIKVSEEEAASRQSGREFFHKLKDNLT